MNYPLHQLLVSGVSIGRLRQIYIAEYKMPGTVKLPNPLRPSAIIRILLAALLIQAITVAQPALPENFLGRPEFINDRWSFQAGTVFYLQGPGENPGTYIVTAHHLFGPMGGLDRDFSPRELGQAVTSIRITDLVTGKENVFRARVVKTPPDKELARSNPFYNLFPDYAVFKIEFVSEINRELNRGRLSRDTLKLGEVVWQAAEPLAGANQGELLHGCAVVRKARGLAYCLFENQELVLNGTSGSPYLNREGEVVGLHSGSLKEPGNLTGIILLSGIIRGALE